MIMSVPSWAGQACRGALAGFCTPRCDRCHPHLLPPCLPSARITCGACFSPAERVFWASCMQGQGAAALCNACPLFPKKVHCSGGHQSHTNILPDFTCPHEAAPGMNTLLVALQCRRAPASLCVCACVCVCVCLHVRAGHDVCVRARVCMCMQDTMCVRARVHLHAGHDVKGPLDRHLHSDVRYCMVHQAADQPSAAACTCGEVHQRQRRRERL